MLACGSKHNKRYDSTGLLAGNSWFIYRYSTVQYRVDRVHRTDLTVSRGVDSSPQANEISRAGQPILDSPIVEF